MNVLKESSVNISNGTSQKNCMIASTSNTVNVENMEEEQVHFAGILFRFDEIVFVCHIRCCKAELFILFLERKKSRKRLRTPQTWKQNVRKEKRQRGEEYISSRNKTVPAKCIKQLKDCSNCIYRCSTMITPEEQQLIFQDFYSLDKRAKTTFITSSCDICEPERRRKGKHNENSRKKATYKYFFKVKERKIQVCKKYFLATLAVSQKTVYIAMQNRNATTNIPFSIKHGKHEKKRIPGDMLELVKRHISSFPRVESHYCRQDSQREYLEGSLTIAKMYQLYEEYNNMASEGMPPVKLSQYRYIFCNNFNIHFNKPKKDRCSVCELNRLQTAENPERGDSE